MNGYKITTFTIIHLQLVAEDGGAHVSDGARLRKTDLDDVRRGHSSVRNWLVGGLPRNGGKKSMVDLAQSVSLCGKHLYLEAESLTNSTCRPRGCCQSIQARFISHCYIRRRVELLEDAHTRG